MAHLTDIERTTWGEFRKPEAGQLAEIIYDFLNNAEHLENHSKKNPVALCYINPPNQPAERCAQCPSLLAKAADVLGTVRERFSKGPAVVHHGRICEVHHK